MSKPKKLGFDREKLVAQTLKSILLTINGLEGLQREYMSETFREVLFEFKNFIGELPEFRENEQLATLDKVFKVAGWDDQGLRYTKEDADDDGEDIFIVHFTNKQHSTWELA